MNALTHFERKDNPHRVSVTQLNIDNLENYKLSSKEEAVNGLPGSYLNGKYLKDLINQVAIEKGLVDYNLNVIEIPSYTYGEYPDPVEGVFDPEISYPSLWVKGNYLKDRFLGVVPYNELISATDLCEKVGLVGGSSVILNDSTHWLHFRLDGLHSFNHTLFVAQKPIRYGISYEALASLGLISGDGSVSGFKKVVINNRVYKVRLLKGANITNQPIEPGDDTESTYGSEWNRLLYRISEENPASQQGDNWAGFELEQLLTGHIDNYGSKIWTQEKTSVDPSKRVLRGGETISGITVKEKNNEDHVNGWLPVLEPVA